MTKKLLSLLPCLLSLVLIAMPAVSHAQTAPAGMTYQGRLTDGNGVAVPDGAGYEIEVRLWNASTGGELLWGTRYTGVPLKSGAFNLILGSGGTPIPGATTTDLKAAFNTPNTNGVHLGLTTTKSATGAPIPSPTEILPRQQLLSSPYAFRCDTVSPNGVESAAIKNEAVDIEKLSAEVIAKLTPVGMISPFVGTSAPPGWLLCNGAQISRSQYPALFSVMGTSHGSGDSSTTFNLPDYRGRFLRGVDGPDGGNADRDPDSSRRQAASPGGNVNGVGSIQEDEIKGHRHLTITPSAMNAGDLSNQDQTIAGFRSLDQGGLVNANFEYKIGGNTSEPTAGRTSAGGGLETRPKNSSVNFIIKY